MEGVVSEVNNLCGDGNNNLKTTFKVFFSSSRGGTLSIFFYFSFIKAKVCNRCTVQGEMVNQTNLDRGTASLY